MILQSINGLVDAAYVGRINASALSGVGMASQMMVIMMAVGTAASIGATALVARFIGADDKENALKALRQSIIVAVILSALAGIPAYLFGPWFLKVMGASGDDLRAGTLYLNVVLLTITPYFLMMVLTGIYRGVGDMVNPLIVMLIATVVAVVGDQILVLGLGPIPRMGVLGAGIATNLSRVLAMVLFIAWLPRINMKLKRSDPWTPDWGWFLRILKIGAPAGLQGVLRSTALMAFFGILHRTTESLYGTAALTVGLRIEALAFLPGFAFSVAATSMVGQNLGAGQPDRAEQSAWTATWQSIGVTSVMGLAFILFAYPICRCFTTDPNVLPLAAGYLRINGISEPFLALQMVLTGALQGAGETKLPAWSTIITQWSIRLPLTWYLAITAGLNSLGAWISMSGTTVIGGLVMLTIFKLSHWKETEI
jgi:putative MATE family efflux protein